MTSTNSALARFFGVVVRGETYLNLLYLLLSFPLGLFYFIFLITGLALGVGMLLLWVGLLILVGMFAAWYGLAAFERWLAIVLLRETIPPMTREDLSSMSLWDKFVATVKNPVTWKGLVYLLARFPLGILFFVIVTTLVTLSVSLIGAPFYYDQIPGSMTMTIDGIMYNRVWAIDTLSEALLVSLLGLFIGLISLHIFNGMAWVSAKFARVMLGNFSNVPSAPTTPTAPGDPAALPPSTVVPPATDAPADAPSPEVAPITG